MFAIITVRVLPPNESCEEEKSIDHTTPRYLTTFLIECAQQLDSANVCSLTFNIRVSFESRKGTCLTGGADPRTRLGCTHIRVKTIEYWNARFGYIAHRFITREGVYAICKSQ